MSADYPRNDWPTDWSDRHIRAVIDDCEHPSDVTRREVRDAFEDELAERVRRVRPDLIERIDATWSRR